MKGEIKMACKYCGSENSYFWNGIELCYDNPECLDMAVIESGQHMVATDDE